MNRTHENFDSGCIEQIQFVSLDLGPGFLFCNFLHAVPSKASFLQRFLSAGSGLDAGSPFSLFGCFMSLQACAFFAKSTVSKLKSEAM